jgi:hypothetical protein
MMRTSNERKELLALVEAHKGEKDERLRLAKLKEEHRRVIAGIGSEDISDPGVKKRMADATLGLALVEARLARLAVPTELFDRIDALHRVEGERWNRAVVAAREAAFEAMIKSQLPFFDGDEAACRQYWKRVNPPHPMLHKFRLAYHDHPSGSREHRDVVREVCSFLTSSERHSKMLKLD